MSLLAQSPASSLGRIRALLIDLSGTLHVENQALPGAVEAVGRLRKAGVPFLCVTNTTKESQRRLQERLGSLGFDISSREIFSSLSAAKSYIQNEGLRPMLFLEEEALEDFADVDSSDPNAVVIGLAPSKFNYQSLTEAFRLIQDRGASLIAIHKARYFKREDGMALGPGCFVTGLEYSTGRQAVVVGKPEEKFFSAALDLMNLDSKSSFRPEDVLMIGDDVQDDVLGAQKVGFKGCLVKTGKYAQGDELRFSGRPDFIFETFADVVEEFLKYRRPSFYGGVRFLENAP